MSALAHRLLLLSPRGSNVQTIVAVGTVYTATVGGTAAATVVAATSAVNAPGVTSTGTAAPAAVAGTSAVAAPTAYTVLYVAPNPVMQSTAVGSPGVAMSGAATAAVVAASSAVGSPTASGTTPPQPQVIAARAVVESVGIQIHTAVTHTITATLSSTWFTADTPKTVTGSWVAGDWVIVAAAIESNADALSTPTATGLTFQLVTSVTAGGSAEAGAYIWAAYAAASGTNVVVSLARTGSAGAKFGFNLSVVSGGSAGPGASFANQTESATNLAVSAGSTVLFVAGDQNQVAWAESWTTGSGTQTGRGTNQDATWGFFTGDWRGTAAGTFSFGAGTYAGMKVAQAAIEMKSPNSSLRVAVPTIARTSTVHRPAVPAGPIDLFGGAALAAHWTGSYGGILVSGGTARFTLQTAYSGANTDGGLSLLGRQIVIEHTMDTDPSPAANGIELFMIFRTAVGDDVGFDIYGPDLQFFGGSLTSVAYNGTTHRWWRIRESGGTVYWDTSTDGVTWTNRRTAATSGFTLGSGFIELGAGRVAGSNTFGYFDNLNNPPA